MKHILSLAEITASDHEVVGGKALALARSAQAGLPVPSAVCITTGAYREYLEGTGLAGRIIMELGRKDFADMRWEELWDVSLRIRNLFLTTPLPASLEKAMACSLPAEFTSVPVAVRSSAPMEDSSMASFAGCHESFVNVRGIAPILEHVRKVWASLWSDRALLYRQEFHLDVRCSAMAVIIQEMVFGERSGVVFCKSPNAPDMVMIEAVWGMNQGLVDGVVDPDQWLIDRGSRKIVSHNAPLRTISLVPASQGVSIQPLIPAKVSTPPLSDGEATAVMESALVAEELFHAPQDVEWTMRNGVLFILQSRPITVAAKTVDGDNRPWYLSLHRSFENLKALRREIEGELLPAMEREAADLGEIDLSLLSDTELAYAIHKRKNILDKWKERYRDKCIPMAHGIRLFGTMYNDVLHPADPFEFTDLLVATEMISLQRNAELESLAELVRENPSLAEELCGDTDETSVFEVGTRIDRFLETYGDLSFFSGTPHQRRLVLLTLIRELAIRPAAHERIRHESMNMRREIFLNAFPDEQRGFAAEILELGRVSYQLRDNDNISLGKISAHLSMAIIEARRRLEKRKVPQLSNVLETIDEALHGNQDKDFRSRLTVDGGEMNQTGRVQARQLVGQPAGRGLARGMARVVRDDSGLAEFKGGEILVCDAIDPVMTFIVPLASAIIERRGGMLIHGAIIAREYGLPCVTGIADATHLITTGDYLTVDGFLGIVTIDTESSARAIGNGPSH